MPETWMYSHPKITLESLLQTVQESMPKVRKNHLLRQLQEQRVITIHLYHDFDSDIIYFYFFGKDGITN